MIAKNHLFLCFLFSTLLLSACSGARESLTSTPLPAGTKSTLSEETGASASNTIRPNSTLLASNTAPPAATPTDFPKPSQSGSLPDTGVGDCPITEDGAVVSDQSILALGPAKGVPASQTKGERLVLIGTVYNESCEPLAEAQLEVWHTDPNGEYGPGHGTDDMQCCFYQGTVKTDQNGRYQLITVRPAAYKGQGPMAAHIHVLVNHPPGLSRETEFLFSDDPALPPNSDNQGFILVTLSREIDTDGEYLLGIADIVLEE